MLIYWLMFLIPALAVFFPMRLDREIKYSVLCVLGLAYVILIGLRFEVGADWGAYLEHYEIVKTLPLDMALLFSDPAHGLFNWLSAVFGFGVYGVNFLYAMILMAGTWSYSQRQPLPWLAFTVAIPYLIVVVGMGYSRQAAAIGFVLLALGALENRKNWLFILLIIIGALFHKSAVFMLAFALIGLQGRYRYFQYLMLTTLAGLAVYFILLDSFMNLWVLYAEQQMESSGAWVRVGMNVVVAVIFIALGRKLGLTKNAQRLYLYISVAILLISPFVALVSTFVDRLMLYLMPLQMLVLSRLPLVAETYSIRAGIVLAIILLQGAVLGIWLNFAEHSNFWVPYDNILWHSMNLESV